MVGYLVGDERVGFLLAVGFHQLLVTHDFLRLAERVI